MRTQNHSSFFLAMGAVLLGGVFVLGVSVGYANRPAIEKVTALINKGSAEDHIPPPFVFAPCWETWALIDKKFASTNYQSTSTEPVDVKKETEHRVWGAIQGLVNSLGDPYSVFLPPTEAKIFEENIQGNFGGVGMEIGNRAGSLTVIAPLKGTPAERAGLRAGDKIIKIDDAFSETMAVDEAVKLIRGEIGTTVHFTVSREKVPEPFDVEVMRAEITIPTIDTETREGGIFVIKLYNFSAVSPDLFRDALRAFVLSGNTKLILDLRGNPGGYLEAAVDMASWFLPAGKIIATEDFGPSKEEKVYRSKGYDIFDENL